MGLFSGLSSISGLEASTGLKMKIAMKLFFLSSFCWMMMDGYPIEDDLPQHPGHFAASRPEILQDLIQRLEEDYPIQGAESERPKRRWWGNKYKDNKSYGFWITALNKAGNVKRGKRSAFIPAMGAMVDDHNPLTGPSDYSDVAELVPDHKLANPVHQ